VCILPDPDPKSGWLTKHVVDALKPHTQLQTGILSVCTHAATLPDLRTLRTNHPHLLTLGFRIDTNNKTPRSKHWSHHLAAKVVQFPKLEKWQIMASIPRDVGGMDPGKAMRLADAMRRTCCALVGGERCRIRAISILARADWYGLEEIEAGEVSRVREYSYPGVGE
jgi:hypothetical protein